MTAARPGGSGEGVRGGSWSGRPALVTAAVGAATAAGDVWEFPVVAAGHGGSAFLLVYLGVVASLGLSLIVAELTIGRSAQRNPVGALRRLGGPLWSRLGLIQILAAFLIASSLIALAGEVAAGGAALLGAVAGGGGGAEARVVERTLGAPLGPIAGAAGFAATAVWIVTRGVRRGLERASRILVPLLFAILALLTARTLTLDGAGAALAGLASPDFAALGLDGVTRAIDEAVRSLAIGVGALVTFGAYDRGQTSLFAAGAAIVGLGAVAVVAGGAVVLVPMTLYDLQPAATGPTLIFSALAGVFAEMPLGFAFGVVLVALLLATMLTSAVALLEPIVAYFQEEQGFRRHAIAISAGIYGFLLGVPSLLPLGAVGNHTVIGRPLAQIIDAIALDVLAPAAALLTAVFAGWVMGHRAIAEAMGGGAGARRAAPWYAWLWLLVLRVPAPLAFAWLLIANSLDLL
jgi:NSS family neurotransmitter:Na+ symporter